MADLSGPTPDPLNQPELTPAEARELAQAALANPELFEELTYQAVAKQALPNSAIREQLVALEFYLGETLSPDAGRQLAEAALNNEELFDALVAHGAVEQTLRDPQFRAELSRPELSLPVESGAKVVRFPHRTRAIAIGSMAAALAVLSIYSWRSAASGKRIAPRSLVPGSLASGNMAKTSAAPPSLDPAAGRPILLAADLVSRASGTAPVFRSPDTDSRAPQPVGTVLSVADQQATFSLGSLDGLKKGTEVRVFRGDAAQPVAHLKVAAVFRDRARASIAPGESVRMKDRVRASPAVYLAAILDETERLADRSEMEQARALARGALAWAEAENVPPGMTRQVSERLGALDFLAGDRQAAERDYQSAAASFASDPAASPGEQAATRNSLAVLYALAGDYARAETELNAARGRASGGTMYARTLNNLAVLAELRGEKSKADQLYEEAERALGTAADASPDDRGAMDANLARLENRAR